MKSSRLSDGVGISAQFSPKISAGIESMKADFCLGEANADQSERSLKTGRCIRTDLSANSSFIGALCRGDVEACIDCLKGYHQGKRHFVNFYSM